MKYTYNDINIGDVVYTNSNTHGVVVDIMSTSYINYKSQVNARNSGTLNEKIILDDEEFHENVWYNPIILLIKERGDEYYLGVRLSEICKVQKKEPVTGFFNKVKEIIKIIKQ